MPPTLLAMPLLSAPLFRCSSARARWASISLACGLFLADTAGAAPPWRSRPVAANRLPASGAVDRLAADELRAFDRAFLNRAAELGRQQMRLAELGLGNGTHADVRSFAMQLATDYRRIDSALDAVTRRKGGLADAPVGGTSETYARLVSRSGADFDREFVQAVDTLTEEVMKLYEQATASARDADVQDFASAQLTILREHRNRAIGLKRSLE